MFERLSRKRQEEGFTLIELLIVIVILGILAAVVVFAVNGISDRGKESACQSDVKTVETAVEAYYAKNNAYPASALTDPEDASEARINVLTTGANKFLKSAPDAEDYVITLDTSGNVTSNPACSTFDT